MSDNNINRLEIKPLIENYMDNLADAEMAISQITGHVTIKNENEYISKTKELQTSLLDVKEWKNDLMDNDDKNNELNNIIESKINEMQSGLRTIRTLMTEIYRELSLYEGKMAGLEDKLAKIDVFMENLLLTVQNFYFSKMEKNYLLIAELLKKAEFLDVINETNSHFQKVLDVPFSYYDKDQNVKNYDTVRLHEENLKLITDKVDKSDYENAKNDFITKYRQLCNKYKLGGSYTYKGEIKYTSN